MWIMKGVSDSDGKKKYGDKFVNYDSMVAKHITASLDPRGDQAHFGLTLGVFHRCWLLAVERSLMAINPNIKALPYWDYTRDTGLLNRSYTSIFSPQYFGSYVGQGADYEVLDGKFAKWPVSKNSKHRWRNPFGYLRHPVSVNKAPYVTRNGGSVCGYPMNLGDPTMWEQCLRVGDSISDWSLCVDSKVHGPAHSSIAGTWRKDGQDYDSPNCAQWYGFINAPSTAIWNSNLRAGISNTAFPYGTFISPYALGCFSCPTCKQSDNPSDCMCSSASSCGPLWTKLRFGNTLRQGSRFIDTSKMSRLAPPADIQIIGDLGDPAGSPNDPMLVHLISPLHDVNILMIRSSHGSLVPLPSLLSFYPPFLSSSLPYLPSRPLSVPPSPLGSGLITLTLIVILKHG
jgi:Common central domain of tyrosinase